MNNEDKISRREFLQKFREGASAAAFGALGVSGQWQLNKLIRKTDPIGRGVRPWWVKNVAEPTVEIDWDRVKRFDIRNAARSTGFVKYVGEAEVERLNNIRAENAVMRIKERADGYTLKDYSLEAAHESISIERSFLGPQVAPTPEERGVNRWEGDTDNAAKIVRAAMRHFGAATVGFIELDQRFRKLIYSHDPDGKRLVFESVDRAYETESQRVIPYKARWVIVYTVQMSLETMKRAPTVIAAQTTSLAYARAAYIQAATQEFIRGLGYQCIGESSTNALGIAPAMAVMAGLGELSRLNRVITPEYGPMVRIFKMITDLPLTPDGPIDAGIMDFCKSCKKCSESCPPAALSFHDEPTWEVQGGWNNPGHKAYYENSVRCRTYTREKAGTNCGICFAVCPFAKDNKVWFHSIVKAMISRAPFLNNYFRSLDDAFSYGAKKESELWWQLDLPEYGINTEKTVDE
ncbi:reductive dehalogenase [Chloroflexota bacterium]